MKLRSAKPEQRAIPRSFEIATVSQPELKEVYFDPEIDIQPGDWLTSHETMQDIEGIVILWDKYLTAAASMALLYPERRQELDFSDKQFDTILAYMNVPETGGQSARLKWLEKLTILMPHRVSELELDGGLFNDMKTAADEAYRDGSWWEYALKMKQLCIMFPARRSELGLTDNVFSELKKVYQKYSCSDVDFSLLFAEAIVILFPDKKVELGLTAQVYNAQREDINDCRRSDRSMLASCQLRLKILAADEVRITAPGVFEFIQHHPLKPTSALPERNKV